MSIDWTAVAATVAAALRARGVESDLADVDLAAYASAAVEEIAKRLGPVSDIELHTDGWGQRYISLDPPAATWAVPVTLATSLAVDDIIDTAADHGLVAGQTVRFTTLTGGAGLVAGTTYWVTSTSLGARTFRVAASSGGVALGFTTDITAGVAVGGGISQVTEEGIALDADDDGYRVRQGGAFLERLGSGYPST